MYQNERTFSVSWDVGMWALNLGIFTFNAILTIVFLIIVSKDPKVKIPMTFGAILIVVGTVLPAIWAPMKYIVTNNEVIIKRIGPDIIISQADICAVNCMPYDQVFSGAVRTMGCGGLFGIYGNFKSSSMGKFRAYMTRRNKLVVIATNERPFVLTPDDTEGFVTAVDRMLKGQPS